MRLTRRSLLRTGTIAAVSPWLVQPPWPPTRALAQGSQPQWRHGLSLFGELKYPPDFKHFNYVNPQAPKSGAVRLMALGTFDNFNQVMAGLKGLFAAAAGTICDTLMVASLDEASTHYGLIAEAVSHPPDFTSTTFRLRAAARHHDGKPITVEDVIYSFEAYKKHNPFIGAFYRDVVKVQQSGEREVTFVFGSPGNQEMPVILGQLRVLPKHWWEGTDSAGKKRDIGATTLEPPLGNGAYRIKEFVPGRSVTYARVKDYWAGNLNVNVGRDNFDEIRYEYVRDPTVALEAFKADHVDWRVENSAKNWATAYDFAAVNEKRVILEEFPQRDRGLMRGFAFNTRRDKFKDARVRRAFNYALDFEEMNKQFFFGQYRRVNSYFEGTELACSGLPEGEELKILEPLRGKVPPEVFITPFANPVAGSPENVRANLREGMRLLREAGYEVRDNKQVNVRTGEPLSVEFLSVTSDPTGSERIINFYRPALTRLGIDVAVRNVDDVQYQNRLQTFDFDVIIANWPQGLSPGNEQRDLWSSQAADTAGSRNYVGIKSPAIDALIDRVIFAKSRSELVAATRALDRALLWNHFVVPLFTYDKVSAARWNRFGRPDRMPEYGAAAFPSIWWWDAERAAKTGGI
ncbi:MAG: ABC transporter substrate-binding protein [Hyphomicrobiales bacterium]|nr:ABC transporter substrate-binding protein [Hyphomicrobiales bacterium]